MNQASSLSGLSPTHQAEIAALREERDPELRAEALCALAGRLEVQGRVESAARIYAGLGSEDTPVAERARRRLQVLQGNGRFGEQAEFAFQNLVHNLSDPAALVAMGAAGAIYRVGRLASLGRLLAQPSAGMLTRGLGARALASTLAFGAEGAAFPMVYDFSARILGQSPDMIASGGFGSRILSSYCVLGGLRLAGLGGRAVTRRLGVPNGFSSLAFGQTAMFGGILLGHGLERAAGLRAERPWSATLAESLATLVHFNLAGSLFRRLSGPRYRAWEASIDLQTQRLASGLPVGRRLAARRPIEALASGPLFMTSSGEGPPRSGSGVGSGPRPESLGEGESQSRRMVAQAWGVFVTLNQEGKIVDVNPAVERVFGYRPDEVLGQSLTVLMAPDLALRHEAGFQRYLQTNKRNINWSGENLPGRHKNGQTVNLHISFDEYERGGQRFFTGLMREIREAQEEATPRPIGEISRSAPENLEFSSLLEVSTSMLNGRPPIIEALSQGSVRVNVRRQFSGEGLSPDFLENFVKAVNFHVHKLGLFESAGHRLVLDLHENGEIRYSARVMKGRSDYVLEGGHGRSTGAYRITPELAAAVQQAREAREARAEESPPPAESTSSFRRAVEVLTGKNRARTTGRLRVVPPAENTEPILAQFESELRSGLPALAQGLTQNEARVEMRAQYPLDFFARHDAELRQTLRQMTANLSIPLGFRIILQPPGFSKGTVFVKEIGGFRRE